MKGRKREKKTKTAKMKREDRDVVNEGETEEEQE